VVAAFPSPADWRDLVIYFLLVDRFANPDAPPRHAPWDGEYDRFQGGSLAGVRGHLDYLKELGVGAIWLSPVLRNCAFDHRSYHGYGIQDFLAVEPRFGSDPDRARAQPGLAERELRELVDEAHARDLYVILDIVLNHTGDVFEYPGFGSEAPWRDRPYDLIRWRDAAGRPTWETPPAGADRDALVWPEALQRNELFRRQGNAFTPHDAPVESGGDFYSLKELVTGHIDPETDRYPVRDTLIAAYQKAIADFDVDGFRIDTLKFVEPDFALLFGNAMREFALSLGKRNFFTFGEVWDEEERIAMFIGRRADQAGDLVGVDAALDFPLFSRLPWVAKGLLAPSTIIDMYQHRKDVQRGVISSHGEASRYFATFVDNHDTKGRLRFEDPADPHRFDAQVTLALGCLFSLQGIPCLYYGTEQGLHGQGSDVAVREALWGKPNAFDLTGDLARAVQALCGVRAEQPALRYGRQYFRPVSGDGLHYGPSRVTPGVLAFSRILSATEVLVVANANTTTGWEGHVIVDRDLTLAGSRPALLYPDALAIGPPTDVTERADGGIAVEEIDGFCGSATSTPLAASYQ
jgi:glycosidase